MYVLGEPECRITPPLSRISLISLRVRRLSWENGVGGRYVMRNFQGSPFRFWISLFDRATCSLEYARKEARSLRIFIVCFRLLQSTSHQTKKLHRRDYFHSIPPPRIRNLIPGGQTNPHLRRGLHRKTPRGSVYFSRLMSDPGNISFCPTNRLCCTLFSIHNTIIATLSCPVCCQLLLDYLPLGSRRPVGNVAMLANIGDGGG